MDYEVLKNQAISLLDGVKYSVSKYANISALLYDALDDVNWVGFYLVEDNKLILGPFQGKVACIEIPYGRGVCGIAYKLKETVLVENVHEFKGHIACDSASNSEIVVPLIKDNEVIAVLDIDSTKFNRFSKEDKIGLENIVRVLEKEV